MTEYYFTFHSLTMAQTGANLLKKRSLPVSIRRTPAQLAARGCGHSLVVGERTVHSAAATLAGAGVDYSRVFRIWDDGRLEEIPL